MSESIASRNAALDARNALLNGGTVEIRTGAPAAVDSAATGTVLATLTINATAFGAASAGSATYNAITAVTGSAAGTQTPGHFVAKNSGGAVISNGTAGTSGTDMILNIGTITFGDNVSITGWTVSMTA